MKLNTEYVRLGVVLLAGVSIGFGAGYIVAKKRYMKIADIEIEQVKDEYRRFVKTDEFSTPAEAAEALGVPIEVTTEVSQEEIDERVHRGRIAYDKIKQQTGFVPSDSVVPIDFTEQDTEADVTIQLGPDGVTVELEVPGSDEQIQPDVNNVFDNTEPDEISYLITEAEFYEDNGYATGIVTYYAGDNVLMGEDEREIGDRTMIAEYALTQFGWQGSSDPKIVHVRNKVLRMDFEVNYDPGRYSETVLGIIPEKGGGA